MEIESLGIEIAVLPWQILHGGIGDCRFTCNDI